MDEVDAKLRGIIIKNAQKNVTENDINEDSILDHDFGIDSVVMIMVIIDLENTFAITIKDEDINLSTLKEYRYLKQFVNAKLSTAE